MSNRNATLNDQTLMERLKKGDEVAFAVLYDRYWPVLFQQARRLLQDEDEIRDVLQDTFTTLWEKANAIEPTVSLSAYLHALVRNRILNLLLRSKVKDKYLASLAHFSKQLELPADYAIREKQMAQRIDEELGRLPEKMRAVFELSRKQSLSYHEIADRLHISQNTVKKQISNAIRQLRLKLHIFLLFFLFVLHKVALILS
jgi:RNA polymerase sigma-70 factor, Bacteroides expansion family 1